MVLKIKGHLCCGGTFVKMAELLQIFHLRCLQTYAPMAFSLAPFHQRTPATTQRTVHYNYIQIWHIAEQLLCSYVLSICIACLNQHVNKMFSLSFTI